MDDRKINPVLFVRGFGVKESWPNDEAYSCAQPMLCATPMIGRGISSRNWLTIRRRSREWSYQFAARHMNLDQLASSPALCYIDAPKQNLIDLLRSP